MKTKKNLLSILLLALLAAGCTTTSAEMVRPPRPVTENMAPLHLNVGMVDIVNEYDPSADMKDASSLFAVQPDIALRRFAEKRFRAAGGQGVFRFAIENASVHQKREPSANRVGQWLGMGGTDEYEISVRVRLSHVYEGSTGGPSSAFTFRRTLSIPDNLSIAEREAEQAQLVNILITDVDRAVTDVVTNKMNLVNDLMRMPAVPALPVDIAPVNDGQKRLQEDFVQDLLVTPENTR